MRNGRNGGNSTDTSPITSWYDLANKSRDNLSDIISFASFTGVDGVFGTWETYSGQKESGARTNTTQPKVVNASSSMLRRTTFVREGIQWKNTLLIDVDVDLDYALLSFCEDAEMRGDAQEQVSILRFDGPIVRGQHTLVLTLKQSGNLLLALEMYAAGSDAKWVMKLDLIGIPSPQL